jgi:hypothetical protein
MTSWRGSHHSLKPNGKRDRSEARAEDHRSGLNRRGVMDALGDVAVSIEARLHCRVAEALAHDLRVDASLKRE